jgi:hypothetical protein
MGGAQQRADQREHEAGREGQDLEGEAGQPSSAGGSRDQHDGGSGCASAKSPGRLYYPQGSEPYSEEQHQDSSLNTGWLYHQGPGNSRGEGAVRNSGGRRPVAVHPES